MQDRRSGRASVASLDEVRAVFETNVFGVIGVTQAMLPLLREAPAARIESLSSSVGSLAFNPHPANRLGAMYGMYSLSKTALNGVTVAFAADLESADIKVNAACPGFTETDLNNFQGARTVQQAAREPSAPRAPRCERSNRRVFERRWPPPDVEEPRTSKGICDCSDKGQHRSGMRSLCSYLQTTWRGELVAGCTEEM